MALIITFQTGSVNDPNRALFGVFEERMAVYGFSDGILREFREFFSFLHGGSFFCDGFLIEYREGEYAASGVFFEDYET